jgi:hypothetical protein
MVPYQSKQETDMSNNLRTLTAAEIDIVSGGNTSGTATLGPGSGLSTASGSVHAGPGHGPSAGETVFGLGALVVAVAVTVITAAL